MRKDTVIQSVGVSVIAAIVSIIAINTFVFTRNEGSALARRVELSEKLMYEQYNNLNNKIDKITQILLTNSKK